MHRRVAPAARRCFISTNIPFHGKTESNLGRIGEQIGRNCNAKQAKLLCSKKRIGCYIIATHKIKHSSNCLNLSTCTGNTCGLFSKK